MTEPVNFQNQSNLFGQDMIGGQNQNNINDNQPLTKIMEVINSNKNAEGLLKFFEEYEAESDLDYRALLRSTLSKLKRYKECVYYGDFLNNKRHGKGVMVYHNGRVYEGEWENDFKHGKGYERFINNSKYEGNFMNGKPEGLGTYVWANGQSYQGQWVNGLKHGSGMWKGARGDSYIGEWKFGKADGYGVHTWLNGDKYEGQFKACLKHGEGTQKFGNGDLYTGSYVNGKPSGYGQYFWANGSFFKGNFKNGLRHGDGVWKRGTGQSDKYEGVYVNDKKCGYGIFTWSSGNIYKGNYFDDVRHGFGQMYWNDGSCYKGNWQKGIQHGQGQIFVPGQQPRKGLFESNVLVQVDNQSPKKKLRSSLRQQSDFVKTPLSRRMINSKFRISSESDKLSNQSKVYPNPVKSRLILKSSNKAPKSVSNHKEIPFKTKTIFTNKQRDSNEQMLSSNMTGGLLKQFQTLKLPQTPQVKPKQKIPHSSFYLHQITRNSKRPFSRDTAQFSLGRTSKTNVGLSPSSNNGKRIQYGVKRNSTIQQNKQLPNDRVRNIRQLSYSFKS